MLSAILPTPIIVIPAIPVLRPITRDEARPILEGKISCDKFMHRGNVDIRKKPVKIKNTMDKKPLVLKVKKINGKDIKKPACKIYVFFTLLDKKPAKSPPIPPINPKTSRTYPRFINVMFSLVK